MRLVSFDALRTLDLPGAVYIKPESMNRHLVEIQQADWLLFPQYWQANMLHYALKKRIFPSINSYHLGHDKIEMTRALSAICPQHVPDTLILANTDSNARNIVEHFGYPFIAKNIRSSRGMGVYLIDDPNDWHDYLARNETLYAQECLPIDRDLRLVVIGSRVVAGYWRIKAEGALHSNVAQGGEICYEDIPTQAIELTEWVAQVLGIDHAGFDLADIGGHHYFFEFNRLFGNQGLNERGIKSGPLIRNYLQSLLPAATAA
ncbi:MAG: ATP-grasp domain-containing protein [Gammaproteobacteria bacterium]